MKEYMRLQTKNHHILYLTPNAIDEITTLDMPRYLPKERERHYLDSHVLMKQEFHMLNATFWVPVNRMHPLVKEWTKNWAAFVTEYADANQDVNYLESIPTFQMTSFFAYIVDSIIVYANAVLEFESVHEHDLEPPEHQSCSSPEPQCAIS